MLRYRPPHVKQSLNGPANDTALKTGRSQYSYPWILGSRIAQRWATVKECGSSIAHFHRVVSSTSDGGIDINSTCGRGAKPGKGALRNRSLTGTRCFWCLAS